MFDAEFAGVQARDERVISGVREGVCGVDRVEAGGCCEDRWDSGGVNGRRKGEAEAAKDWDEVALAHYPSIWHFADMLASGGYQEVNRRFRVPGAEGYVYFVYDGGGVGGGEGGGEVVGWW